MRKANNFLLREVLTVYDRIIGLFLRLFLLAVEYYLGYFYHEMIVLIHFCSYQKVKQQIEMNLATG